MANQIKKIKVNNTEYNIYDDTVPNWARQSVAPTYDDTEIKQDITDLGVEVQANTLSIETLEQKKANKSDIPDVSSFITKTVNNLTNYYLKTETYTQEEVNNLISAIPKFKIEVVDSLPTTEISTTTVYLLRNTSEAGTNLYEEYIYVNNKWELLGSANVDLSNYYTKTETDALLNNKQETLVSGTNIKTINDESILGNGNIEISGGGIKTYDLSNTYFGTSTIDLSIETTRTALTNIVNDVINGGNANIIGFNNDKFFAYKINAGGSSGNYAILSIIFTDRQNAGRGNYDNGMSFTKKQNGYYNVYVLQTEYDVKKVTNVYSNSRGSYSTISISSNENWWVIDNETTINNFMSKENTTAYTPTSDYHPATKKYVDDLVGDINTQLATLTTVEE